MFANNVISMQPTGLGQALSVKQSAPNSVSSPKRWTRSPQNSRARWGHQELAKAALLRADYSRAKLHLTNMQVHAQRRGDFKNAAVALNELAWVQLLLGNNEKAAYCYGKALDFWKNQRHDLKLAALNEYMFFIWDYAVFLRAQGDFATARKFEIRLDALSYGMSTRQIALNKAERLAQRAQYFLAEQIYEDAFIDAGVHNELSAQLRIACKLVPIYRARGKHDLAEAISTQIEKIEKNQESQRLNQESQPA
jgi:hypothetical protein